MSEALEYRIMRNRNLVKIAISYMSWCFGIFAYIIFSMGVFESPLSIGIAFVWVAFWISAAGSAINARGAEKRGYCRTFVEMVGSGYADPPLNEWANSLEEREEFESIHSPVRLADGGKNE